MTSVLLDLAIRSSVVVTSARASGSIDATPPSFTATFASSAKSEVATW